MTPIKTFNTRVEAELARIALSAEGIPATVVGLDVAFEGGAEGVRLLVADDQADAARKALANGQSDADRKRR
jgi:putative signal transducing protein